MRLRTLAVLAMAFMLLVPVAASAVTYLDDGFGFLYTVNPATGSTSLVGNMGVVMTDIALDPAGNLYGITFSDLYSIDRTTAAATHIGAMGRGATNSLGFDSAGTLYAVENGGDLDRINVSTGAATLVGATGFGSSGDIAYNPNTGLFWLTATGGVGGDRLVTVDPSTAGSALVGDIGFGAVFGVTYDGTNLYGFTNGGDTLLLDQSTGAGAFLNINGIRTNGSTGQEANLPFPSTVVLYAVGALAGLGVIRARKS